MILSALISCLPRTNFSLKTSWTVIRREVHSFLSGSAVGLLLALVGVMSPLRPPVVYGRPVCHESLLHASLTCSALALAPLSFLSETGLVATALPTTTEKPQAVLTAPACVILVTASLCGIAKRAEHLRRKALCRHKVCFTSCLFVLIINSLKIESISKIVGVETCVLGFLILDIVSVFSVIYDFKF